VSLRAQRSNLAHQSNQSFRERKRALEFFKRLFLLEALRPGESMN
jgi:hypothetical protein